MNKEDYKSVLKLAGLIFLVIFASYTILMFFSAYLAPGKSIVTFSIDKQGEAAWELVFIILSIPVMVYALYKSLRKKEPRK